MVKKNKTVRKNIRRFRMKKQVKTIPNFLSTKRVAVTQGNVLDSDVGTGLSFKLSSLPDYSDFTNAFDSYRIVGIKYKYIFSANTVLTTTSTTNQLLPNFYYVVDTNSVSGSVTIATLCQHDNMKVQRIDRPITVYFKPKPAVTMWNTAVASGYSAGSSKMWMDMDSPSIEYYGLKTFTNGSAAGGVGSSILGRWTQIVTYYLQFKGTR